MEITLDKRYKKIRDNTRVKEVWSVPKGIMDVFLEVFLLQYKCIPSQISSSDLCIHLVVLALDPVDLALPVGN